MGPIDVAVRLVDDVDHDEDAGVEVDLDDDVVCRGCSIHLESLVYMAYFLVHSRAHSLYLFMSVL